MQVAFGRVRRRTRLEIAKKLLAKPYNQMRQRALTEASPYKRRAWLETTPTRGMEARGVEIALFL